MKRRTNYMLNGRVTNLLGQPVEGLTIHAYDRDLAGKDDFLREATTDRRGAYTIRFTSDDFKKGLELGGPDVFIRAFRNRKKLGESPVECNAGEFISIDLEVDAPASTAPVAEDGNVFRVSGTVQLSDPFATAGRVALVVHAYDQGLRERRHLGQSAVNDHNRYDISYQRKLLFEADRGSANLVIEVVAADEVLLSTAVRFNSGAKEVINLLVDLDARKSEWARLRSRVQRALKSGALAELSDHELEFVVKSEGVNAEHLKLAVRAARAAEQTKLPDWFHYALARNNLPLDLNALLETAEARVFAALNAAQIDNVIDPVDEAELTRLRRRFAVLQAEHLLAKDLTGVHLQAGKLFALAGLNDDQQQTLARALMGRVVRGSDGSFILPAATGLDEQAIARVRSTLLLADFTDGHEATLAELVADERINNRRDLAKHFDPQHWRNLVERATAEDDSPLPGDLEGATPAARRRAYAERLYERAAGAYPNVALAYGLSRRPALAENAAAQLLPDIVEQDDEFNLATVRLDGYLESHKEKLGVKTDEDVRAATVELKRVQRLYRLKPDMEVVAHFLEDEERLDSAAAIVQKGKRDFVDKYGRDEALGVDAAAAIFREAEIVTAKAFGLFAKFSEKFNTTQIPLAIACPAELKGVPDYSSLFGSLDGCECEPCESVYSPAAYLTDLLSFLKREVEPIPNYFADNTLASRDGLEALATRSYCNRNQQLFAHRVRRPDIVGTLLSCRNAETELPYVDLVLEILENAVAAPPAADVHQTNLPADQLAAQPEYFNAAAYEELSQTVFPFSLPFDLPHEEQKLYLEKLGISQSELLETFYPYAPTNDTAASPDGQPYDLTEIRCWMDPNVARARLGLTETEWSLIVTEDTTDEGVAKAWGFANTGELGSLSDVAVVLSRSGLDYKDLLRLFVMKSFNPDGEIGIPAPDLGRCDSKLMKLSGFGNLAGSFLPRFLRLQRRLGWTMQELDQALMSLSTSSSNGRPELNPIALTRLSHLIRLRARFKLPLREMLAWWSNLDTRDYRVPQMPHESSLPSLYESLFLTGRPGDADYELFQLNAERTELKAAAGGRAPRLEATHLSAIAGALKISLAEVTKLIRGSRDPEDEPEKPLLNLETLSRLFRHASLARALRLSIDDYAMLRGLIAIDPFAEEEAVSDEVWPMTLQTLRFVARADAIRDSRFSIAELDYLLLRKLPFKFAAAAPTVEWIEKARAGLEKAFAPLSLPSRKALVSLLNLLPANAGDTFPAGPIRIGLAQTLRLFEANGGDQREEFQPLLKLLRAAGELLAVGNPGPAVIDTLDVDKQNRIRSKLVAALAAYDGIIVQLRHQTLKIAATSLAELLKLPAAVCEPLLDRVPQPSDRALKTIDAFEGAFVAQPPRLGDDDLVELLYVLHKAALVIDRLGISAQELADRNGNPGYFRMSSAGGWLDLTRLPVRRGDLWSGEGADPALSSDDFLRTVKLFQLRDILPPDQQPHLFELFDAAFLHEPGSPEPAAARSNYARNLRELLQWDSNDISQLLISQASETSPPTEASANARGLLRATFPESFKDERLPLRILSVLLLVKRLGVSVPEVATWLELAPDETPPAKRERVERIKNALKARCGDAWFATLKPLRDPLRERQRQALVTYLLDRWQLDRADELFDHFLIDVEMSPCMMTSRLIQAVAAVQLFVQRVLMNLEPGLAVTDDGAEQWEWMKNYRVWEANRKIFLYPENWIEPELRDDKTPFFKDLENELLQADINNDTAETALVHYLEKLHDVSRLQVCGQYLEVNSEAVTLHVFARTRDVPHHYYYRKGIIDGVDDLKTGKRANVDLDSALGALNAYWTPWEKVDVDIEGDHLIPVVYNRRVYLFWPIFTSEDEPPFAGLQQQLTQIVATVALVFQEMLSLVTQVITGVFTVGENVQKTITDGLAALTRTLTETLNQLFATIGNAGEAAVSQGQQAASNFGQAAAKVGEVVFGLVQGALDAVPFGRALAQTRAASPGAFDPLAGAAAALSNIINFAEQTLMSLLPAKRLEVQLAWSEYKGDSWSAKKISSGAVTFRDVVSALFESLPELPGFGHRGVRRLFTFHGSVFTDNQLIVRCKIALPQSLFANAHKPDKWLSAPTEIGHFRLNGCNGKLEAIDTKEDLHLIDLLSQGISQVALEAKNSVANLRGDRQLTARGEPVTPDDDDERPSPLRDQLQRAPLPIHEYPPYPIDPASSNPDPYRILARHQETIGPIEGLSFDVPDEVKHIGFFYQDISRTFFCFPCLLPPDNSGDDPKHERFATGYIFFPFYHPYTCTLLENIRRAGIPGIYQDRYRLGSDGRAHPTPLSATALPLQLALKNETFFASEYKKRSKVYDPPDGDRALRPIEEFNFSTIGAYSQYNWEIFFHIPLLIATRLSTNQKFSEAQHWFHYIFNPTDHSRESAPAKYWRTRPFTETTGSGAQNIDELLRLFSDPQQTSAVHEIERAVSRWRHDAFNPHLIARTRTVAFQKAVVMKYIDNLVAWGDSLFRRETRESVNEAMQLYILAAKLLGPRPRRIPKSLQRPEKSFAQLEPALDAFSNELVDLENYLPAARSSLGVGRTPPTTNSRFNGGKLDQGTLQPGDGAYRDLLQSRSLQNVIGNPGAAADALYFCVPPNEKLLAKWDLVADRLFKIRHCQNIQGQALSLALLAPPIDPAILVRARAAGVDIDEVLGQLQGPSPHYRFQTLSQKASELCGEVKSLGAALLSALEKRDGEELALLRNTHEARVLEAARAVKKQQVKEASLGLEALRHSQVSTSIRRDHYQRLLLEFMNPEEIAHTGLTALSLLLQMLQANVKTASASVSLIPNTKLGFVTTLGTMFGGNNTGDASSRASDTMGIMASLYSSVGGLISTMGTYHRRADDWALQIVLASKELDGLNQQIAAAEIRVAIAEAEVENQTLQIRNSREVQEYMQQKFTNHELFDWMVGQTSALYFQSYQLALEVARKAERSFALELGVENPAVIKPAYWNSLRKGLLAGELLHHDLKRLEVSYLNENAREPELTKQINLRQIDPLALLQLRATGRCSFTLPEALFDLDCPGQWLRRIKTVALSIPCITGPYTNVNCRLRLLRSGIRSNSFLPDGAYTPQEANESSTQFIITSSAQNDSGLFEPNLRDERYLPFENAGAISEWQLELPADPSSGGLCQFDYETISNVVLHLRYTARDGNDDLRQGARDNLDRLIAAADAAGSVSLFSVRHDFINEWARFKNPPPPPEDLYELSLDLRREHYPFWSQGRLNRIVRIEMFAASAKDKLDVYPANVRDEGKKYSLTKHRDRPEFGNLLTGNPAPNGNGNGAPTGAFAPVPMPAPEEKLTMFLDDNQIDDLWIAIAWGA